jgi:hypothetical protein
VDFSTHWSGRNRDTIRLAISKAGAAGLGQLMPATARDLGVSNRFDPMSNIFGAARYLRQMLDKFGVVHLALAAYNAGPGAVERAGGIPRNGETPAYVRTCCVVGASEQGVVVSSGRIRVSGMLSRGQRGMILTTKSDEVWIVESEEVTDDLFGSQRDC